MKKTLVLWSDGKWSDRMVVESIEIPMAYLGPGSRFKDGEIVAVISHESGNAKTTQGSRLQPMNEIELRAFGVQCIEMAADMQKEKKLKGEG